MNRLLVLAAVMLLLAGCTSSRPTIEQGPNAEVTFDGLHKVDGAKADRVWVKPGLDLSQYDKIKFEGAGIQYRSIKPYVRNDPSALRFPLSDEQKQMLEEATAEVMREELSQIQNYEMSETRGPGVLLVTLSLRDVVSKIPPDGPGRGTVVLSNLGHAVLLVDIRDSHTGEALARIYDLRQALNRTHRQNTPIGNLEEIKRELRLWGEQLREGLDELHELGCYACDAP